jgi:curli biogenesis system outer membrane secretion channel CsgG
MRVRIPNSLLRSSVMGRCVRCCAVALAISLLTGAAEAQFWAKKKKPEDKPAAAAGNSNSSAAPAGASAGSASSLESWTGPKLRLAVMDLSGSALKTQVTATPTTTTTTIAIPPPSDFARGLSEMLTTALIKTNRFVVLERAVIDKIQAEQDLGAGGRVAKESAPIQGKILGAQAMVTGDITEFSYTQSSLGGNFSLLKGFGAKVDKVNALVAIDIRVIDAVSGQVLASQRSQGKASMSNLSADLTKTSQAFNVAVAENTPLGQATRQALAGAVAAIANGMQKERWAARVIDFRDGLLYINAGSEIGVQPGFELDVFRPQDALLDPETGQSLGAPDRKTGSVTVQSIQPKYSVAKVNSGSDFKRGDIVRMKGEAQHD